MKGFFAKLRKISTIISVFYSNTEKFYTIFYTIDFDESQHLFIGNKLVFFIYLFVFRTSRPTDIFQYIFSLVLIR
jgi:hypothetical protein